MNQRMKFTKIKAVKLSVLWLLVLSFFLSFRGSALTAVDDSATTLPNTPLTLAVLTNDLVSTSNAAAADIDF